MIKVLHILGSLGSGGVESLLYNWYETIDKNKFSFDFIVNGEHIGYNEKKIIGNFDCQVFHVPKFKKNIIQNIFQTKSIIKNGHYDIVHVHHTEKSFIQLSASYLAGSQVRIAHSHDCIKNMRPLSRAAHAVYCFLTKLFATHYCACGIEAGQWVFGQRAVGNQKVMIIKNGIEILNYRYNEALRNEMRKELNIEHQFVLGHVGRFTAQKNHAFLIDVFKNVLVIRPEAILLLVGEGELRQSIEKKVKDLALEERVIFLGVRDDIPELLFAMDLFVLPSLHEGLGIVLIEAQSTGLQGLTTRDLVPYDAKITDLVQYIPLDVKQWVAKITKTESFSRPDMTLTMTQAGYDLHATVKDLENLYLLTINKKQKGRQ
ncbi:MAG: glycosyltransferase family 1 protein, partial [Tissierellales bacterium]|nr:glycosyltransferase family 1 protein [Tissierellales bacterium]MBN2827407.1 glycosyltransferase family 1 protein [Tissierellales bacterium]